MKKPRVRQLPIDDLAVPVEPGLRACGYYRVSTGRQSEANLSIPSQRQATRDFCDRKGWTMAAEFVEPGATATDDQRPEFQKTIERACGR
jgi:site-specific DNA recombinase